MTVASEMCGIVWLDEVAVLCCSRQLACRVQKRVMLCCAMLCSKQHVMLCAAVLCSRQDRK